MNLNERNRGEGMLTIIILVLLLIGFYTGARRGLVLQIVYSVGYILSFAIAKLYYTDLAKKIELYIPYPSATESTHMVFFSQPLSFDLDGAFYGAVAFMLILFAGWLLTRFIGMFFHKLMFFPILKQLNTLGGGLISLLVMYVGIFLILSVLSLIPMESIQSLYETSGVAQFIVKKTPFFSKAIYEWWIVQMTA